MTPEVWFRKADTYPTTCIDLLLTRLSFSRSDLRYRAVDVDAFLAKTMSTQVDYRCLVIGEEETIELRHDHGTNNPWTTYPTWNFETDDIARLEYLCDTPPEGRSHRVVVMNVPKANTGIGKRFFTTLRQIQADFPYAIIHVHGLSSYRIAFGFDFRSVDIDPQATARREAVMLPNGRTVNATKLTAFRQWVSVLGYAIPDLAADATRVAYNVRSAEWAADHWGENLSFKAEGPHDVDPDAIEAAPATTVRPSSDSRVAEVGDKVLCDQCSLSTTCKYFRDGAACSLPGSVPAQLATTLNTRDPDTIILGLGRLMEIQADRLEDGLSREKTWGGGQDTAVDPTVTTLIANLFEQGVKLAKLIDPKRFTASPKVVTNIGVGSGGQVQLGGTPQTAISAVFAEFERQGVPREDVTPQMVEDLLGRMNAIDVPAVEAPRGT